MKDTARTVLTEAGINVDTALKRFLDDEEMYFEFLNSFVEDTLMSRLKQAVQNGSVDDAFEAAHAMKGLCANLSIDSMSKMIVPMVEILRGRSMEGIPEDFKGLSQTYENVCGNHKSMYSAVIRQNIMNCKNKQTIKGRLVKDRLPLYLCKDNGDE